MDRYSTSRVKVQRVGREWLAEGSVGGVAVVRRYSGETALLRAVFAARMITLGKMPPPEPVAVRQILTIGEAA